MLCNATQGKARRGKAVIDNARLNKWQLDNMSMIACAWLSKSDMIQNLCEPIIWSNIWFSLYNRAERYFFIPTFVSVNAIFILVILCVFPLTPYVSSFLFSASITLVVILQRSVFVSFVISYLYRKLQDFNWTSRYKYR